MEGRMRTGSASRGARTLRDFAMGFALIAVGACTPEVGTPGLEPPWADPDRTAAPVVNPPGFGNPAGAMNPPGAAGATGSPTTPRAPTMMPPATSGPSPAAGSGASSGSAGMAAGQPAQEMPTDSTDAGTAPPPTNAFGGIDFLPGCANERAYALTADMLCAYPLPEGVEVDPALAQVALLSNGTLTTVTRADGPLDCDLLSGGFFFDASDAPTQLTLCPQSCLRAGAAAEMQVVLVLGCAPAAP
jgi:hypothetical protein